MELGLSGSTVEQKYYQQLNYALFTGDPDKIEEFIKERTKPGAVW